MSFTRTRLATDLNLRIRGLFFKACSTCGLVPRAQEGKGLSVVSLNLGGRNLNPLEFVLDGDDSEVGQMARDVRLRAQEAMVDAVCGPAAMAPEERARVNMILDSTYKGADRGFINGLLE